MVFRGFTISHLAVRTSYVIIFFSSQVRYVSITSANRRKLILAAWCLGANVLRRRVSSISFTPPASRFQGQFHIYLNRTHDFLTNNANPHASDIGHVEQPYEEGSPVRLDDAGEIPESSSLLPLIKFPVVRWTLKQNRNHLVAIAISAATSLEALLELV